jgi:hypothetical protein
MIINLQQKEVAGALHLYLVKQGFNLQNKTVDIKFSSTRKDSGVLATISIEEIGAATPVKSSLKVAVSEPKAEPEAVKTTSIF